MTDPVVPPAAPPVTPLAAPAPPVDMGFPSGTPIDQMTDAQQAAYWKHHSRKHEDEAKTLRATQAQYEGLGLSADQIKALIATTQTDQERAVEQAKQEARAAAQLEAAPRVVRAEFKAAAKGVLDDTQLAALLEDRDLTKYVTETGEPDEAKIAKIVADAAPKEQQRHVTLGQGPTRTDVKPSVSSGRDAYRAERAARQRA